MDSDLIKDKQNKLVDHFNERKIQPWMFLFRIA